MEFLLQLPQDIDKDGALWQTWNSFSEKFQYYQIADVDGASLMDASSLLLFAAHHEINSLCTSLKMYNLDLPKVNKVLELVEQACLPYLFLLFERFRYFNLKREVTESLDDFTIVLQKQAELCEFGSLKDSIMKTALYSSLNNESLMQFLSRADGLHANDFKDFYGAAEILYANVRDYKQGSAVNTSDLSRVTRSTNVEMVDHSSGDKNTSENISSCADFRAETAAGEMKVNKVTEKQNKHSEEAKKAKLKQTLKFEIVTSAVRETDMAVTNMVKDDESEDVLPTFFDTADNDCSMDLHPTSQKTKKIRKKFAPKQYDCCFCERIFAGQNCLWKHLVSKHKDSSEYSCKICNAVFVDVEEYLVHYKNVHVKQQKPQLNSIPTEKLKIKKEPRFNCTLCKRVFIKEDNLKEHICCSQAKSFLCWNCGESYKNLSEYRQHSEKHAAGDKFTCDFCQKNYPNIFSLVEHLKNHLKSHNKCGICDVVYIRPESLARHITKMHTVEPAYKCSICWKPFLMEDKMLCHMNIHYKAKRFTCELCGKTYANKNNLVIHGRWHRGEKPFGCPFCGKHFRSSGDLIKHKRKHSDKSAYMCEVCGRGFSYRSAMVRHQLGHTGKRSYVCGVCGRTFIYHEGLRDHIKASRCPGRIGESGYNRSARSAKQLLSRASKNAVKVESKVFDEVHTLRASDKSLTDIQDWLRNSENDGETTVVLVTSLY